jgi:hypothetical protein
MELTRLISTSLEFLSTITFNPIAVKKILFNSFLASSVAVALFSCRPTIDTPAPTKGSLDVSKYVAIGSTISAGYADNALYHDGQENSYPNMLAKQFKLIGGGDFKQPLVDASSVGIGAAMNARLVLGPVTDCSGATSLAPIALGKEGDFTIFLTSVAANGPFNNMSVPGAKATTTVYPGYGNPANGAGNFNPFFTRMTADPATASVLSDAASQVPTFFTMSVGTDDVYGYAISGGTKDVITPSAGAPGFGFDASIDAIAGTLAANAKGAIANIPEISSLPYFTTVPYNALVLDNANATALSAAYQPLGITFHEGPNAFIIEDANAPGGMRQIHDNELILLSIPQDSIKCMGWGSMKPIPNQYVLTETEITAVNTAITAYNTKLKATAEAMHLAFVDMNAFLKNVKKGIVYNGVSVSASFVQGGAFSLDGIHLTPLGNALLANEFIKSINSAYGSTIPKIDATMYKGVSFP